MNILFPIIIWVSVNGSVIFVNLKHSANNFLDKNWLNCDIIFMRKTSVILFFCIAIIVFGIILIVSGVIGLNKAKEYDKYSGILEIPVVPTPDTTPTTSPTSNTDEENPVIDLMVPYGS